MKRSSGCSKLVKFFLQKSLVNNFGATSVGMEQEEVKQNSEDVVRFIGEEEEESVFYYSWKGCKKAKYDPVS